MDPILQIVAVEVAPVPEAVAWRQRRQPLQLLRLRGQPENWPPSGPPDAGPLGVASAVEGLLEGMTRPDFRPDWPPKTWRVAVRVVDFVVAVVETGGGGGGGGDGRGADDDRMRPKRIVQQPNRIGVAVVAGQPLPGS